MPTKLSASHVSIWGAMSYGWTEWRCVLQQRKVTLEEWRMGETEDKDRTALRSWRFRACTERKKMSGTRKSSRSCCRWGPCEQSARCAPCPPKKYLLKAGKLRKLEADEMQQNAVKTHNNLPMPEPVQCCCTKSSVLVQCLRVGSVFLFNFWTQKSSIRASLPIMHEGGHACTMSFHLWNWGKPFQVIQRKQYIWSAENKGIMMCRKGAHTLRTALLLWTSLAQCLHHEASDSSARGVVGSGRVTFAEVPTIRHYPTEQVRKLDRFQSRTSPAYTRRSCAHAMLITFSFNRVAHTTICRNHEPAWKPPDGSFTFWDITRSMSNGRRSSKPWQGEWVAGSLRRELPDKTRPQGDWWLQRKALSNCRFSLPSMQWLLCPSLDAQLSKWWTAFHVLNDLWGLQVNSLCK